MVWSTAERQREAVEVNTQTTDGGGEAQLEPDETQPWRPPLDAEQWSGTIPSSAHEEDTKSSEPGYPTEADLLDALEEYERQEQQEALEAARAGDAVPPAEEGSGSESSHRRRRFVAAAEAG